MNLFEAERLTAIGALKGKRYEEKVAVVCHFHKCRHLSSFGILPTLTEVMGLCWESTRRGGGVTVILLNPVE